MLLLTVLVCFVAALLAFWRMGFRKSVLGVVLAPLFALGVITSISIGARIARGQTSWGSTGPLCLNPWTIPCSDQMWDSGGVAILKHASLEAVTYLWAAGTASVPTVQEVKELGTCVVGTSCGVATHFSATPAIAACESTNTSTYRDCQCLIVDAGLTNCGVTGTGLDAGEVVGFSITGAQ